jgi:hypothetical protein
MGASSVICPGKHRAFGFSKRALSRSCRIRNIVHLFAAGPRLWSAKNTTPSTDDDDDSFIIIGSFPAYLL